MDQVRWLYEVDYGDFKRKVGLYISRFEQALPPERRNALADLLSQMRDGLLFGQDEDVERARQKTLAVADQMRQRIEFRH